MLSLQNLKRQAIYFATPRLFNDPYDCTLSLAFDEPTDPEIEKLRRHFLADEHLPAAARVELESLDNHTLKNQLQQYVSKAIEANIDEFLSNNGVSCFSESNDHLLMWGHYGGRYGGFCLEFRTDYEPFTKIRPVKYVETMPRINLCEFIVDRNYDQIMDLYCTKNKQWEYEREWRSRHKVAGTSLLYDATALKAIYFGPNMDSATREIICLILQGQNPTVEFWLGRKHSSEFKLEFNRFEYTSYAEAKRKGLL